MYGIAKKETVPISNKKPMMKVFANLKNEVSTSLKFQIKKAIRTNNETEIKKMVYAFKSVNRFGKSLKGIEKT